MALSCPATFRDAPGRSRPGSFRATGSACRNSRGRYSCRNIPAAGLLRTVFTDLMPGIVDHAEASASDVEVAALNCWHENRKPDRIPSTGTAISLTDATPCSG